LARVLISVRCLPSALPVFLEVSDQVVSLASAEDAVVEAARRGDVLAVQVDGAGDDGATWSVQVTGTSRLGDSGDVVRGDGSSPLHDAIQRGAALIIVPTTVIHGEQVTWGTSG
jgi:hypothetical protein